MYNRLGTKGCGIMNEVKQILEWTYWKAVVRCGHVGKRIEVSVDRYLVMPRTKNRADGVNSENRSRGIPGGDQCRKRRLLPAKSVRWKEDVLKEEMKKRACIHFDVEMYTCPFLSIRFMTLASIRMIEGQIKCDVRASNTFSTFYDHASANGSHSNLWTMVHA